MQLTKIVKTMSSREIAELTGKEHRHVLADTRTMLESLGIDCAGFSAQYKDASGKVNPMFILPKRETLILVSGYSVAMRAKIIDRWQELEQQAATPAELSRLEILNLARDSEIGRLEAVAQLAIAAPKVEALDRLTLAEGAMCITNAAKSLGLQPKRLFAWMQANGWIYRRPGSAAFIAYQTRIKTGVLDHKITTVGRSNGSEKVVEQVLVTAKGLIALAGVAA